MYEEYVMDNIYLPDYMDLFPSFSSPIFIPKNRHNTAHQKREAKRRNNIRKHS